VFWPEPPLEAKPVSARAGPVVAVSVCACEKDSFQIAVLRSWVNSAPGASVISCGTVSENVIVLLAAVPSASVATA